jgi:hypothetical protein
MIFVDAALDIDNATMAYRKQINANGK